MLDNLLNLVKEHAGDAIIDNPAIPNEKNDAAIQSATHSIVDTLKTQVAAGKLDSVLDLFKGNQVNASGITAMIQSNAAGDLMQKIGIDQAQASQVVSTLLPKVMEQFVHKTNDPADNSFDLKDIVSSLGNGAGSGLLGNITNLFN